MDAMCGADGFAKLTLLRANATGTQVWRLLFQAWRDRETKARLTAHRGKSEEAMAGGFLPKRREC